MSETTPEQSAGAADDGAGGTPDAPVAKKAARKRAPRKKATAPAQTPASAPTLDVDVPSGAPADAPSDTEQPAAPVKRAARKRTAKATAASAPAAEPTSEPATESTSEPAAEATTAEPAKKTAKKAAKRTSKKAAKAAQPAAELAPPQIAETVETDATDETDEEAAAATAGFGGLLFQAPDPSAAPAPRARRRASAPAGPPTSHPAIETESGPATPSAPAGDTARDTADAADAAADEVTAEDSAEDATQQGDDTTEGGGQRKRRRRGGRGRRGRTEGDTDGSGQSGAAETGQDGSTSDADKPAEKSGGRAGDKAAATGTDKATDKDAEDTSNGPADGDGDDSDDEGGSASSRRRRRRRRRAGSGDDATDDPPGTVTKVRQPRTSDDQVASVKGSTRLEAKKQRRRDGREAGRRKPVITESEFLARRESVDRTMIVRERAGRTQIAVLEDEVLVEHYVANETNASMIGNVYLGRVQNVLPSMEAAFIDIGKGRNAVLYAGEVNWDAAGLEGQPRRIEVALKSGDSVLVQVTKDPMGHKGARLTSQISLPGRYLVYVPNSSMTGISRKLPDTERARLKKILKAVVPEQAGVIVRTAAEGASEAELQRDVERLTAQWEAIEKKSKSSAGGSAPKLLHGEPDLTVRVIRDVFNEDFNKLVVSGGSAWDVVQPYVDSVAADLAERVSKWTSEDDVFAAHRVDEQLAKAMDRKVWLPSGGSLVIDRTEAMTVVDVNTGKFTGSGGNLEETVTRNNLEAAEEIVRQLRLRDIGGIIVVDFIDMVLESNRDLVLRRLLECLGRDRTKHQVAEVTSLGLVQMTRKRVGQGLLEVFSEPCEHCNGRGILVHADPVQSKNGNKGGAESDKGDSGRGDSGRGDGGKGDAGKGDANRGAKGEGSGRSRRGRGKGQDAEPAAPAQPPAPPRQPIPAGLVASLAHHHDHEHPEGEHAEGEHAGAQAADTEAQPTDTQPTEAQSADAQPAETEGQPAEQFPVAEETPVAEAPVTEAPATEAPVAKAPRRRRRASAPAGPPVAATD